MANMPPSGPYHINFACDPSSSGYLAAPPRIGGGPLAPLLAAAMASIAATSNGGSGALARRWPHGDGQHRRYVQRGIRRAVWQRKVGGTATGSLSSPLAIPIKRWGCSPLTILVSYCILTSIKIVIIPLE